MRPAVAVLCVCGVVGGADGPRLGFRDVVNAADYSGGRVSPGEIIVLTPSEAGPDILAGAQLGADGKVTTSLGDTRVLFDGIAAPISYSVKGQVGAVVPYGVSKNATTQVVVEYKGVASPPVTLPVVAATPALFTLDSSGKGQGAMLNETGCCNSMRNPAARGSIAVLYATGAGEMVPAAIDGTVPAFDRVSEYPSPRLGVGVTVGGVPAEILFAGAAPHTVSGLLQVNFRVPALARVGDAVPLVLSVGSSRSPDGVTMAIRPARQQILVIESARGIRDWLHRVLEHAGYELFTARNSREALLHARAHPVDLVISDVPSSGQERMEAIRIMTAHRPGLRIAVTASGLGPDTLKTADLLGAQAVFSFPLQSKVVIARVRELLRSRPVPYAFEDQYPGAGPAIVLPPAIRR